MAKQKAKPTEKRVVRRSGHVLPKYCECGGEMDYAFDFGRVFSYCKKCTPVVHVRVGKNGADLVATALANGKAVG